MNRLSPTITGVELNYMTAIQDVNRVLYSLVSYSLVSYSLPNLAYLTPPFSELKD